MLDKILNRISFNCLLSANNSDVKNGGDKENKIPYEQLRWTNDHEKQGSTYGVKYPTHRDVLFSSGEVWMDGKRADDGAEGLWRIHNDLYDFSEFMEKHPGGEFWLKYTKGTDITEAFEVHHISQGPEKLLPKFRVRSVTSPRNSPYTFEDSGLYRTLKRRVRPLVKDIPRSSSDASKFHCDILMLSTVISSILTVQFESYIFLPIAALLLALCTMAAHNFCHQRDNMRMHYFSLSGINYKDCRLIHVMSHHLHTNTVQDLEISMFEPSFLWLSSAKKTNHQRYMSILLSPLVYATIFTHSLYRRWYYILRGTATGSDRFDYAELVTLLLPTAMFFITGKSLMSIIYWWHVILTTGSLLYGLISLNSTHHHLDSFHDGDTPRVEGDRDWALCQLDSTLDRKETKGSHFLGQSTFGDHSIHHLFPTLDHGKLKYIFPTVTEVLKEFGVEMRVKSQWDLFRGNYQQLLKNKPNPLTPNVRFEGIKKD